MRELLIEKTEIPDAFNRFGTIIWQCYDMRQSYRNGVGKLAKFTEEGKCWLLDGVRHREGDKPALIGALGSKFWYKYGKYHRDGNKPAIIWSNGQKFWFKNGIEYFPNKK